MSEGFVTQQGEGRALRGPVVGSLDLMLTGDRTGGAVTAFDHLVVPGGGPPLHLHEAQDELWRVVTGTVRFLVGDELTVASAGAWAFAPRGVPHCFQNVGDQDAVLATMMTPSGMEQFFVDLSRLAEEDVQADTFALLGARHGMVVLGPPLHGDAR